MRIFMIETRRGSEDGFAVRCFEAGRTYDAADAMARAFIRKGWASEDVNTQARPSAERP